MDHDEKGSILRICLVSNSDIIRHTVNNFLVDLGHEVVSSSLTELGERLKQIAEPYDVLIILQSITKTFLRKFHQTFPHTMIFLLSDNRSLFSSREALDYGVFAFLHTPLHFNELEVLLIRLAQYSQQLLPAR